MSGGTTPPNKFPIWVDLSSYPTPADKADKLGIAYQQFYDAYEFWPTVAIAIGEIVYLGAYGSK